LLTTICKSLKFKKMKNSQTQSAQAKDGHTDKPVQGQASAFHGNFNPAPLPNVKENRNTGEMKKGTSYLRGKQ
jgi:hypothetical protein